MAKPKNRYWIVDRRDPSRSYKGHSYRDLVVAQSHLRSLQEWWRDKPGAPPLVILDTTTGAPAGGTTGVSRSTYYIPVTWMTIETAIGPIRVKLAGGKSPRVEMYADDTATALEKLASCPEVLEIVVGEQGIPMAPNGSVEETEDMGSANGTAAQDVA